MKESVIYQEIEAQGLAKGLSQGLSQGLTQGSKQKAQQIALNLIIEGMSVDFIARATGLTIEQVQQLQQNQ